MVQIKKGLSLHSSDQAELTNLVGLHSWNPHDKYGKRTIQYIIAGVATVTIVIFS